VLSPDTKGGASKLRGLTDRGRILSGRDPKAAADEGFLKILLSFSIKTFSVICYISSQISFGSVQTIDE
jgi:hypothetical protein